MLGPARFQVLLQLGAGRADVVGPLQRVHPLVERPLGGRGGGLDWGGHVGGEYSRGSSPCKGIWAISGQIHLDLESRSKVRGIRSIALRVLRKALRRPGGRPGGPGSSQSRPRPASPRRRGIRARRRRSRSPPCRRSADPTAAATARTWATAIGRTAGPERPPWPAASAGLAAWPGRSRSAFSVLISETASAPPSSAATATAAGSATFGVSLTINGFSVSGRSASSSAAVSPGCSPTISPEWTLGQETLSSIAATSSRSATASTRRANSSWLGRHHRDDQRHRQLGQLRQVLGEEPLEPLVRQPDRVDHPRRRLPDPLRLVADPRLGRDRLRDEGGEGELLEQRVAVHPPGGDRVEGPRGVDDGCSSSMPQKLRRRARSAARASHPALGARLSRPPHASRTGPSTQRRM